MTASQPLISLIIPAYNESRRIGPTLEKAAAFLSRNDYSHEIIVVDDGSSDGTGDIVARTAHSGLSVRLLQNGINRGKGYSVKRGVLESRGKHVLFSDADLSTPIEETKKLLTWLEEGWDVAIGSRKIKGSDIQIRQPWYRETMGKTFNLLVRILGLSGIRDTQCGFKCFRRDAAAAIFRRVRCERFAFDVEVLLIAAKLGHRIKEVPVIWRHAEESRVHPVTDASRMFWDLLMLRINDWRGEYARTP